MEDWPGAVKFYDYCPLPPDKKGTVSDNNSEDPHVTGRGYKTDISLGRVCRRPEAIGMERTD